MSLECRVVSRRGHGKQQATLGKVILFGLFPALGPLRAQILSLARKQRHFFLFPFGKWELLSLCVGITALIVLSPSSCIA